MLKFCLFSLVVNNAGGGGGAVALQATTDEIESTFKLNVFSALYMMQATVPKMPRGGRIINISSIASTMGIAPITLYCSAKAALDQLTYACAMEVRKPRLKLVFKIQPKMALTEVSIAWNQPWNYNQRRCARTSPN